MARLCPSRVNMVYKLIFFAALCVMLSEVAIGVPMPMSEKELEKSVAEFLAQDKEFQNAVEHATLLVGNTDALSRHVRQVEGLDGDPSLDGMDDQQPEGFFNRAAKFVMELLQRFLKWVNQPDNS